jgi:hypothetical protein
LKSQNLFSLAEPEEKEKGEQEPSVAAAVSLVKNAGADTGIGTRRGPRGQEDSGAGRRSRELVKSVESSGLPLSPMLARSVGQTAADQHEEREEVAVQKCAAKSGCLKRLKRGSRRKRRMLVFD